MTDKEHFQELKEIEKQRNKSYYDWIKGLVVVATGLLSVIVSLKTKQSSTIFQSILFVIIVSTLVLGILFGAGVIYSEVLLLRNYYRKKLEHIYSIIYENGNRTKFEIIKKPKIFYFFSYCCYVCLLISFISLIIYSVSIEFSSSTTNNINTETQIENSSAKIDSLTMIQKTKKYE